VCRVRSLWAFQFSSPAETKRQSLYKQSTKKNTGTPFSSTTKKKLGKPLLIAKKLRPLFSIWKLL
jgi:hypothetical protein